MTDSLMGPCVPSRSTVLIKPSKMCCIFGVVKKALFFEQLFLKVCDADDPMLRKFMGGS